MSDRFPDSGLRHGVVALAAVVFALSAHAGVSGASRAEGEVRALRVVRRTLSTPEAIDTMVTAARAAGFNTLLVEVRDRVEAVAGGLVPHAPLFDAEPGFDPLAATIARAHAAGLAVHAWVNVNLVSSATDLPLGRDHVVYRHPEWLMVPRALADDLARVDPRSPQYLGRLARFVRARPNAMEGLSLTPIAPGAAAHTVEIVREIVARYPWDGVHLDHVRYPRHDFDYSRDTLLAFRRSVIGELAAADRAKYDRRLPGDPLVYTEAFPERWQRFRTERLTSLVSQLHKAVKAIRPRTVVSAAVDPDLDESVSARYQDWRSWLAGNLIDVVCPMTDSTDAAVFATQLAVAREAAGSRPLWAGIGAHRLSPPEVAATVDAARRAGVGGPIFFSYDRLTGPARGLEYLSQVGRVAFDD